MTDIQAAKIQLAKTILDTDNVELIEAVDKVLRETQGIFQHKKTIGSKPDGTPLTQQDLKEGIHISEQEIKEGKYSSIESLAEKWNINLLGCL